jgi:hypothetical protein
VVQLIIDDFEGDLVRLETPDLGQLIIPRAWLSVEARPGDHLDVSADQTGLVQFTLNPTATQAAFLQAQSQLEALTKEDTGGDITL